MNEPCKFKNGGRVNQRNISSERDERAPLLPISAAATLHESSTATQTRLRNVANRSGEFCVREWIASLQAEQIGAIDT